MSRLFCCGTMIPIWSKFGTMLRRTGDQTYCVCENHLHLTSSSDKAWRKVLIAEFESTKGRDRPIISPTLATVSLLRFVSQHPLFVRKVTHQTPINSIFTLREKVCLKPALIAIPTSSVRVYRVYAKFTCSSLSLGKSPTYWSVGCRHLTCHGS